MKGAELLSMALGEIAELEQVAASVHVLPGRQAGGLVAAELSEQTTKNACRALQGH